VIDGTLLGAAVNLTLAAGTVQQSSSVSLGNLFITQRFVPPMTHFSNSLLAMTFGVLLNTCSPAARPELACWRLQAAEAAVSRC